MNITFEWVAGTLMTLAIGGFWRWADKLGKSDDEITKKLEAIMKQVHDVEKHYQSKADARVDSDKVMELLKEIKADVKEVRNELYKQKDKSCP